MANKIEPDWPAPGNVRAFFTTRSNGFSSGPYDSLNLALHVDDNPRNVESNRSSLDLPTAPHYLNQVHGNHCVEIDCVEIDCVEIDHVETESVSAPVDADASYTNKPGAVLAIMVADCLPVLFTSRTGDVVGVAHAGWRGLAAGVLTQAVRSMKSEGLVAWMGPAIGKCHYEVGDEVRDQFASGTGFTANDHGHWQMDLYSIARSELSALDVEVFGGGYCTYCEEAQFFSHRRDGITGRMAGFIWLTE